MGDKNLLYTYMLHSLQLRTIANVIEIHNRYGLKP